MTLVLDFAPRRQLIDWLSSGWSPVPGYEYMPGEWAFLLVQDGAVRIRSEAQVAALLVDIPRPAIRSNRSRACKFASDVSSGKLPPPKMPRHRDHGWRSKGRWAEFRAAHGLST